MPGAMAHGVTATLVADAHVTGAQAGMNFGTLTNLEVGNGYTTLVAFDLSTLPSGTTAAQVSRATLRLFANRVDTAGTLTLQPLQGTWGEYSVTAGAMPTLGTAVGTAGPILAAGSYVTVDVTAVVQGWITAPGTNFGLALTAGSAVVQLDSKENDLTSHPATLEISLVSRGPAGPAGMTGATGSAGATGATGAQGPTGVTGLQGPAGPAGAPGAVGAMGPAGPVGVMNYQGIWSSRVTYPANAVVTYAGSSYLSLAGGNVGATPGLSPTAWGLLAAAGQNGTNATQTGTGSSGESSLNYQGAYASATSYAVGAVVVYGGSSYVSLVSPNQGNTPGLSDTFWGLLAAAGTNAAAGGTGQNLQYQGMYVSGTNYGLGDIVQYAGSSYVSLLVSNHGNQPGSVATAWGLLAAAQVGPAGPAGALGVAGPAGVQGLAGPVGPQGPAGVSGPAGPAGAPGLVYRGAYNAGANYGVGDVVLWQGAAWASLTDTNRGNAPDQIPGAWGALAQAGPAGPAGAQGLPGAVGPAGAQGLAGPAGPPGSQGAAGPQGPAGVQGLAGPQGPRGDMGAQGLQGPAGVAGVQGLTGVEGPQGPQGARGAQGPTGQVGLAMRGAYSSSVNYAVGDGVTWNGAGYVSMVAGNVGNTPSQNSGLWLLFAAAGADGAAGATGPAGTTGAVGPQGPAGLQGVAGPQGQTGVQGPPVANYRGNYQAGVNYALNDAVSFRGSTYISLLAGNQGNVPDGNAGQWAVLAAQGSAGPAGGTGATGAQGLQGQPGVAGAPGPQGPAGVPGAPGAVGMNFRGGWAPNVNYAVNDAVTDGGSSWIAVQSSTGVEPVAGGGAWSVLAQAGSAGPVGTTGSSATVTVGSVQTGAPGSAAAVTNSGTATAAVLNFTIPAGASGTDGAGGGGSGAAGTSGVPYMSVQHAVQFGIAYYPVNAATGASNETTAVLTWVPGGCTATKLSVYSLQGNPVTVTLRSGLPGAMRPTSLSCVASSASSCTAQGSETVTVGSFVDLSITGSNGTSSPVWTAVSCN